MLSYVLSKNIQGDENWINFQNIALEQASLFASRLFGLTVFLCDDFLSLKPPTIPNEYSAYRFFRIAQQLPMELQMVLARRVFYSPKNEILSQNSHKAFNYLFRAFHPLKQPDKNRLIFNLLKEIFSDLANVAVSRFFN